MVISARISFVEVCVRISFGFDVKSLSKWESLKKTSKKSPKIVKQVGEKNTTFSQRTLMVFLSKWGGPAAPTLHLYPSILGLGERRWREVEGGEANDPPTPFHKS